MVQPGLINSPETHNIDSVVAQACCVPAGHLTLYQFVAAGLGPDHGKRERERHRMHAGPASLVRVSGGNGGKRRSQQERRKGCGLRVSAAKSAPRR